jgi:SAM-dependent methyltransferase
MDNILARIPKVDKPIIFNNPDNAIYNLCNICGNKNNFKNYKPCRSNHKIIFRNKMYCEKCDSQERHRFIWEYIKKNQQIIKNKQVVHCASEFCLFKPISKLTKTYNKIDKNPRPDQIQMDILNMTFESESIDTFICSHVLEHIKDDNKAIKEIARILKKDGTAILLVPINGREYTTEFSTPNKEDFDHYRNYGYIDFIDKLKLYFTSVKRILPQDILDEQVIDLCSLSYEKDQGIFECKK